MALPIEDYAMIGDCQSAALVGMDGSIDWLCVPRFDSPACFAALLGEAEHGRWKIAPLEPITLAVRAYRGESLVLETTFETASGAVSVTDCMPVKSGQVNVVRIVRGLRGKVAMRSEFIVRFDYGNITPWVRQEPGGVRAIAGPDTIHLRTDVPLHGEGWATVGDFEVAEDQEVPFVLTWHASHLDAPVPIDASAAVWATEEWWGEWSSRCTYRGRYRDAVIRSLIVLKGCTYAPTGGIVAAPTTSLPEHLGGPRNWDYRFCWLRDATFTLTALIQSGYVEEAVAWRKWLLRTVAGKGSELQIMYGLSGERRLHEIELPWLPGYEGSKPVRIGNGAYNQFQLDVYGEVLDCLHLARHYGLKDETGDWRVERQLLSRLEEVWRDPDEGIWEVRGPRQHFTHSKLMAWVGFDRAVKDVEKYGMDGPVDHWRQLRDELHAEICDRGFNRKRNAFTQFYGSSEIDSSLLMMALVGFLPADDPRIVGTVEVIEKELIRDGFVDRYHTTSGVDGLPASDGSFFLTTFWLADNYALMGRFQEARMIFERILAIRNDVGLLAEEYNTGARRQLGNFPQAYSHLGLVNTARNLTQMDKPAEVRQQA
jgi:GH15 family glucan-1,4-alpha-glucosidase